jgi:hypothetical protein
MSRLEHNHRWQFASRFDGLLPGVNCAARFSASESPRNYCADQEFLANQTEAWYNSKSYDDMITYLSSRIIVQLLKNI